MLCSPWYRGRPSGITPRTCERVSSGSLVGPCSAVFRSPVLSFPGSLVDLLESRVLIPVIGIVL
jgi:hypothetical protein